MVVERLNQNLGWGCPWGRHIHPCLVLFQPRKTCPPHNWKTVDWDIIKTNKGFKKKIFCEVQYWCKTDLRLIYFLVLDHWSVVSHAQLFMLRCIQLQSRVVLWSLQRRLEMRFFKFKCLKINLEFQRTEWSDYHTIKSSATRFLGEKLHGYSYYTCKIKESFLILLEN